MTRLTYAHSQYSHEKNIFLKEKSCLLDQYLDITTSFAQVENVTLRGFIQKRKNQKTKKTFNPYHRRQEESLFLNFQVLIQLQILIFRVHVMRKIYKYLFIQLFHHNTLPCSNCAL